MSCGLVELVGEQLAQVRAAAPLVHNITNFVVMQHTANALLALGASPVMAHAQEEVEEIASIASALVLNIGTLAPAWVASMHLALETAQRRGIPVVIDPVGVGASQYRTRTALELLQTAKGCLLRGNASEVMALAGAGGATRGVDSTALSHSALGAARQLATQYDCTVCISGAVDIIVQPGGGVFQVEGGHPLMCRVTGMGCTASALAGAFAATAADGSLAAMSAMAVMAAAGSIAAKKAEGPGTFVPHFLDALYGLQAADVAKLVRVAAAAG